MVQPPFDNDPWLDDFDLFYEGILSREDATEMFRRGEITETELQNYLKNYDPPKPVEIKAATIILGMAIFIICIISAILFS
jgi:hypothetical protein